MSIFVRFFSAQLLIGLYKSQRARAERAEARLATITDERDRYRQALLEIAEDSVIPDEVTLSQWASWALVERAASESNAPSSRLRRPGAGSAGQPLGANPSPSEDSA